VVPADPVPLSVLGLDLPAPGEGWSVWLAAKGVSILFDDLGRRAVSREDARALFDAQRLSEIRRQDAAHRQEAAAIAADRAWRATLPQGIPWHEMPGDPGGPPASAMLATAKDARPRRTPSHGEWLFSDPDEVTGGTFNGESGDDW
jgi:hypothetical protein